MNHHSSNKWRWPRWVTNDATFNMTHHQCTKVSHHWPLLSNQSHWRLFSITMTVNMTLTQSYHDPDSIVVVIIIIMSRNHWMQENSWPSLCAASPAIIFIIVLIVVMMIIINYCYYYCCYYYCYYCLRMNEVCFGAVVGVSQLTGWRGWWWMYSKLWWWEWGD